MALDGSPDDHVGGSEFQPGPEDEVAEDRNTEKRVEGGDESDDDFEAKPKSSSKSKPKVSKKKTKAKTKRNYASPTKSSLAKTVRGSAPSVPATAAAPKSPIAGPSNMSPGQERRAPSSTFLVPAPPAPVKMDVRHRCSAKEYDLTKPALPAHVPLNQNKLHKDETIFPIGQMVLACFSSSRLLWPSKVVFVACTKEGTPRYYLRSFDYVHALQNPIGPENVRVYDPDWFNEYVELLAINKRDTNNFWKACLVLHTSRDGADLDPLGPEAQETLEELREKDLEKDVKLGRKKPLKPKAKRARISDQ